MNAGTTTFQFILDKPLNQLTENDISQVTREDCRKYLKEKGMRRPSWNKSQAIQQVISLKALLEPCDDSGAGALRKVAITPRVSLNQGDSTKEPSDDAQDPVSVNESVTCGKMDPPRSVPEMGDPPLDSENKVTSPRSEGAPFESVGQMTIFYCGKVNVYDGVAPEKARGIMHLAASPIHFPNEDSVGGTGAIWHSPPYLQTARERDGIFPPSVNMFQTNQSGKMVESAQQHQDKRNVNRDFDAEGQANRKVSLQRYLVKRKDRGRLKSKKNPGLNSSLEAYYNYHVRTTHISNGNPSEIRTLSHSQPGLPQGFVGSTDNQAKIAYNLLNLNVNDIQEC